MALTEKDRYELGGSVGFYEEGLREAAQEIKRLEGLRRRQVVKAQDMGWESSRHGRIKHLINEKMDYPVRSLDLYLMVLPPGGRSGKHRHMAEEMLYILEGQGYDMHWDPNLEISDKYYWRLGEKGVKYEWETEDVVYIPPMVAHQHFNTDPGDPARFLAASHRGYRFLGYPELEQLEDAPDYRP